MIPKSNQLKYVPIPRDQNWIKAGYFIIIKITDI